MKMFLGHPQAIWLLLQAKEAHTGKLAQQHSHNLEYLGLTSKVGPPETVLLMDAVFAEPEAAVLVLDLSCFFFCEQTSKKSIFYIPSPFL